jgi:hypothetical protein
VGEEDLDALTARVERFAAAIGGDLRAWRTLVEGAAAAGQNVAIWGGGSKGATFLATLGLREQVACAVDINPKKDGTFLPGTGQPIVAPAALQGLRPALVILMNPIYEDEVRETLAGFGLSPRIVPVDAMARGALAGADA